MSRNTVGALALGFTLAAAVLATTGALAAPPAKAGHEAEKWAWIRVSEGPDDRNPVWEIHKGETEVHLRNGHFHAVLRQEGINSDAGAFVLDGTIVGSTAKITEIHLNTDAGATAYIGKAYRRSEKGPIADVYLMAPPYYISLRRPWSPADLAAR